MTDHKFKRSPKNPGALINTDAEALRAYKLQKRRNSNVTEMMEETKVMKKEIAEIKALLTAILEKL